MPAPQFPLVDVTTAGAPDLWTAYVRPGADQRVALHSTRAPRVEAGRQLEIIDTPPAIVALIGAGLGFVTEAARERWPDARIVVFEPSAELARHARARTPALYASDRISLLTGPDYASDPPLWRLLDQGQGTTPAVIVHPVIARLAPEAAAAAEACARRAIQAAQMNERARQDNAPRYLLHTLRNLAVTVDGIDLAALHGRLAGVPIVVVAAGPSLDRQLPALRALEGRAVVIAADTAWRPLAAAGIDPHIVVALDPTEMNGRHLLRVPARRQPWLLAELSIDPHVAPTFGARAGAFRVANHHPWPWAGTLGLGAPVIRVWGSVITACTDLALSFGGDPIVFAGADLAFTGGQPYCRGTTFEEDWARVAAQGWSLRRSWDEVLDSKPTVIVPDVNGAEIRTAPYLIEFRDWLVARASEHRDRRFVNATGGGILVGAHIEQADLASIAAALLPRALALDDVLNAAWTRPTNSPHARTLRETLREALRGLERDAATATDGAAAAPLSDWLHFGRPRLTLTDVHAALVAAGRALDEATSPKASQYEASSVRPQRSYADDASPLLRRHLADRVAQMRAWMTGDHADGAPAEEPAVGDRGAVAGEKTQAASEMTLVTSESSVGQALARLLAEESPLASGLAVDIASVSAPECVPLSYRYAWTPDVMPLIASLEEALLDAREADVERLLGHRDGASSFWRRPDLPTFGADDDAAEMTGAVVTTDGFDTTVRSSAVATVLGLMTTSGEWSRSRRLCDAVARGLADPRQHRTARTRYRLRWRDRPVDVPLRIDALMGALTGTLAPLAGFGPRSMSRGQALPLIAESRCGDHDEAEIEPRLLFLRADTTCVQPIVLTDRGLAPGLACETMSDSHASFVPGSSRHSFRIDATGQATANAPWPDDVNVEAPWGLAGGVIAWSAPRSEVFWRAAPEGDVSRATLPFRPQQMVVGQGTMYWLAGVGGLWEWAPGRDARLIAETSAHGSLELAGVHIVLHPFERDPVTNQPVRRRQRSASRYEIASGAEDRVALSPVGQSGRTCIREAWTVRSHPYAGCITFTHQDGRVVGLACQSPFCIAWAGASLIVTTLNRDVLVFRDLWPVIPTFV
jgi:hypothetical protein